MIQENVGETAGNKPFSAYHFYKVPFLITHSLLILKVCNNELLIEYLMLTYHAGPPVPLLYKIFIAMTL